MTDSILPGTLVSPEWLAERLDDPRLAVVDIRGYVKTEDLGEGRQHAEYVGARDEYDARAHSGLGLRRLDDRHRRPGPRGQSAVGPGRRVRRGDEPSAALATRPTSWSSITPAGTSRPGSGGRSSTTVTTASRCSTAGSTGGKRLGLPLTDAVPELQRSEFTPRERPSLRVEAEELLTRIGERSTLIVDARDPAQYTGAIRRGARGGHVPTAVNIWAKSLVNDDGTWKSDEELREILEAAVCGLTCRSSPIAMAA